MAHWHQVQNQILLCSESLTCPLQQDAITSILHYVKCVLSQANNHSGVKSSYSGIAPILPLKYGAPFAIYSPMLDSYGVAAAPLPLILL